MVADYAFLFFFLHRSFNRFLAAMYNGDLYKNLFRIVSQTLSLGNSEEANTTMLATQ